MAKSFTDSKCEAFYQTELQYLQWLSLPEMPDGGKEKVVVRWLERKRQTEALVKTINRQDAWLWPNAIEYWWLRRLHGAATMRDLLGIPEAEFLILEDMSYFWLPSEAKADDLPAWLKQLNPLVKQREEQQQQTEQQQTDQQSPSSEKERERLRAERTELEMKRQGQEKAQNKKEEEEEAERQKQLEEEEQAKQKIKEVKQKAKAPTRQHDRKPTKEKAKQKKKQAKEAKKQKKKKTGGTTEDEVVSDWLSHVPPTTRESLQQRLAPFLVRFHYLNNRQSETTEGTIEHILSVNFPLNAWPFPSSEWMQDLFCLWPDALVAPPDCSPSLWKNVWSNVYVHQIKNAYFYNFHTNGQQAINVALQFPFLATSTEMRSLINNVVAVRQSERPWAFFIQRILRALHFGRALKLVVEELAEYPIRCLSFASIYCWDPDRPNVNHFLIAALVQCRLGLMDQPTFAYLSSQSPVLQSWLGKNENAWLLEWLGFPADKNSLTDTKAECKDKADQNSRSLFSSQLSGMSCLDDTDGRSGKKLNQAEFWLGLEDSTGVFARRRQCGLLQDEIDALQTLIDQRRAKLDVVQREIQQLARRAAALVTGARQATAQLTGR